MPCEARFSAAKSGACVHQPAECHNHSLKTPAHLICRHALQLTSDTSRRRSSSCADCCPQNTGSSRFVETWMFITAYQKPLVCWGRRHFIPCLYGHGNTSPINCHDMHIGHPQLGPLRRSNSQRVYLLWLRSGRVSGLTLSGLERFRFTKP